jgi:hypothetical protein
MTGGCGGFSNATCSQPAGIKAWLPSMPASTHRLFETTPIEFVGSGEIQKGKWNFLTLDLSGDSARVVLSIPGLATSYERRFPGSVASKLRKCIREDRFRQIGEPLISGSPPAPHADQLARNLSPPFGNPTLASKEPVPSGSSSTPCSTAPFQGDRTCRSGPPLFLSRSRSEISAGDQRRSRKTTRPASE